MSIFVARHGETLWNIENRVLGRTDIALTDKGRNQALILADTVIDKNIEKIISSPLKRAMETSSIVAERIGIEFSVDKRLIEQDFGIYEGVFRDDEEYQRAKREYFKRYPNGESYLEVAHRVYSFLKELKDINSNVLVVTHGGICRIINNYFYDMNNEEFVTYTTSNCGFREYSV